MIMLLVYIINYAITASLVMTAITIVSFTCLAFQKKSLTLSTKGWMNALVSDFYYCIMAPLLVLYANPIVWKNIRSLQRTIEHLSFMYPKLFLTSSARVTPTPSNNQVLSRNKQVTIVKPIQESD